MVFTESLMNVKYVNIPIRSSEIVRWGNVPAMIIETSAVNFASASTVFSFMVGISPLTLQDISPAST